MKASALKKNQRFILEGKTYENKGRQGGFKACIWGELVLNGKVVLGWGNPVGLDAEIEPTDIVADEKVRIERANSSCPICDGNGFLRHYMHVSNGICFKCGGTGKK
jgi:hypothetical protein